MYKNIKEFARSKTFQGVLIGVAIALGVLVIFQAGVFVGYRKASFTFRFGDNYSRVFERRAPRPLTVTVHGGFMDAHAASGEIVSVNLPTFVLGDEDDAERVVRVGADTIIRRLDEALAPEDLAPGDVAVVLGVPNEDSEIEAKLIRLLPPPSDVEMLEGEGGTQ